MTTTIYQGRKWDAPMTDDAVEGVITGDCTLCREPITPEDNAIRTPWMNTHLECNVRSGLGDVQHLEGRCICAGKPVYLPSDDYATYRESAKATLAWLIAHNRGRFHP